MKQLKNTANHLSFPFVFVLFVMFVFFFFFNVFLASKRWFGLWWAILSFPFISRFIFQWGGLRNLWQRPLNAYAHQTLLYLQVGLTTVDLTGLDSRKNWVRDLNVRNNQQEDLNLKIELGIPVQNLMSIDCIWVIHVPLCTLLKFWRTQVAAKNRWSKVNNWNIFLTTKRKKKNTIEICKTLFSITRELQYMFLYMLPQSQVEFD